MGFAHTFSLSDKCGLSKSNNAPVAQKLLATSGRINGLILREHA